MFKLKLVFLTLFIIIAIITVVSSILANNYMVALFTFLVLFLVIIDFIVRTTRKKQ